MSESKSLEIINLQTCVSTQTLWQGTWSSTHKHPSILNGTCYIYLPLVIDEKSMNGYATNLFINYCGLFKHNIQVTLPVNIVINSSSPSFNFSILSNEPLLASFSTLQIERDANGVLNKIDGTYQGNFPYDVGIFSVIPSSLLKIPIQETKACIVM